MPMRAPLIRVATALVFVAATLQAQGQQQQAPPQPPPQDPKQQQQDPQRPPTFRSRINFIRVDVIVSDKDGKPVLDLKPEEFSVAEDGHAQKIEQFDVVKIDPLDQVQGPSNGEIRS